MTQFSEVTGADYDVAEGVMKKFKWALDAAMDGYYENPDGYTKQFAKKTSKKSPEPVIFSKYAGEFVM